MSDENPHKRARVGTHHGWCITVSGINGDNSIEAFVTAVEELAADDMVNIAVIGDELNSSGGRHAQAFLNFPSERGIAFGRLKKLMLDAGVEACDYHQEPRKSKSMDRAGNYCLKEHFEHIAKLFPEKGTIEELYRADSKPLLVIGWDIEGAKPDKGTGPGSRTDLGAFKSDVHAGECRDYDTAMLNHSGLCARAERFVRIFIGRFSPIIPMSPEEWHRMLANSEVRRWQAWAMHELANTDVNYRYRKVHVVTDCVLGPDGTGGNSGKSHFCEWFPKLMANVGEKVQVLGPGKLADMANQLQSDTSIVLIDIPASRSDNLQWSFVEQLKSGRVDSPKYHSCSVEMKNRPVRVMILCNQHPDERRRPNFEEFTNENGFPVDGYGRPRPREYTLSSDRWVEYPITSGHDVEAVSNFMLPAEMGFGPEFSSDNAGDGPVAKIPSDFWRDFVTGWESFNERWSVMRLENTFRWNWHGPNSPNAESLNSYFRSLGWDGVGILEVGLRWRDTYFCDRVDDRGEFILENEFTARCLVNGRVSKDDPRGIVLVDSQGRVGRVYFNEYGEMVDVHALDPNEHILQWGVFVHAYSINRGGMIIWEYQGLPGFMNVDVMNGKFSPMPGVKPSS